MPALRALGHRDVVRRILVELLPVRLPEFLEQRVQPKLELTTHFLIVGSALYRDPETNEPLEEPLEPSELAAYKDAEALGVQIIPLQDIREFFRIRG